MFRKIGKFFLNDLVFTISFILAIITSFISKPSVSFIDFKVLAILFNLMVVVKAFEKYKLLDAVSIAFLNKCRSRRKLTAVLCILAFFSSMFLTNEVAVLALVPITLAISKKSDFKALYPVILITVAANLGSMATPMGNPQNIYLYQFYNLNPYDFFTAVLPVCAVSFAILSVLTMLGKNRIIIFALEEAFVTQTEKAIIFGALFLVSILAVFSIVHYFIAFAAVLVIGALLQGDIFKKVDYKLLATFVFLFIIIGNVCSLDFVTDNISNFVADEKSTFISGVILSQIISTVPSALLLSAFTSYGIPLILGVNIGGAGTLIASFASIISYRIYIKKYRTKSRNYLISFFAVNLSVLLILSIIFYFTV